MIIIKIYIIRDSFRLKIVQISSRALVTCPPKTGPLIMSVLNDRGLPGGGRHAQEPVLGGADRRHLARAGSRGEHERALPSAWDQPADLLSLEAPLRGHGGQPGAAAEGPGRGERPAQAAGGRAGARQSGAQGGAPKKLVRPAQRRAAAGWLRTHYAFSERHACRLVGLGRSTARYRSRRRADEATVRQRLRELATERPRFGYRRLHALLRREGVRVNHKRVERLYRAEGLAIRKRG